MKKESMILVLRYKAKNIKTHITPKFFEEVAYALELENEPCEDCISRQDVCEWYCNMTCGIDYCTEPCLEKKQLWDLPSVLPEQKIGHWIKCEILKEVKCSDCGMCFNHKSNYCPNCGVRMKKE